MEEKEIKLTNREKSVIECIKKGIIDPPEIARELNIALNYVNNLYCDLYFKFDVMTGASQRAKLVWEVMNEKVHNQNQCRLMKWRNI